MENDAEIDDKYREAFGNENFKAAKEAALEMRETMELLMMIRL